MAKESWYKRLSEREDYERGQQLASTVGWRTIIEREERGSAAQAARERRNRRSMERRDAGARSPPQPVVYPFVRPFKNRRSFKDPGQTLARHSANGHFAGPRAASLCTLCTARLRFALRQCTQTAAPSDGEETDNGEGEDTGDIRGIRIDAKQPDIGKRERGPTARRRPARSVDRRWRRRNRILWPPAGDSGQTLVAPKT